MTVQLNHLITDFQKPNKTSFEILEHDISTLKLKSIALSTLEKVCYVALLILVTAIFAISYNFVILTGAAPFAMTGLVLASPILVFAPAKFAQLSQQYTSQAEFKSGVFFKLKEIEHYTTEDIEQFFRQHNLNFSRLPIDALRQVAQENPYKALLPMIAQFNYLNETAKNFQKRYEEAPGKLQEGFERMEREGQIIERAVKQKNRYESEQLHWEALERRAIPYALNAATLLHLIENPTMTDLNIIPLSLEIPGVGSCAPRPYAERCFAKTNPTYDDDYFIFDPRLNRTAISHAAIEAVQMDPVQLRPMLYRV